MMVDRVTYVLERCRGRHVLHLGCTDWPYTEERLKNGVLLHGRLAKVARSLVGVDSDHEGVACFHRHGFPDTFEDNVEQLSHPELQKRTFEMIIAGEVIEHLENPGMFLRSVQKLMTSQTELIVTTINAYCFFRFIYYLFKGEMVHPDHNYYFSPAVLHKLLTRCGLEPVACLHYPVGKEIRSLNPRKLVLLDDVSRLLFPRASDGLIIRARRRVPSSGPE